LVTIRHYLYIKMSIKIVIQPIEVQINKVINYKRFKISQVHQMDFSLDNIRMHKGENRIKSDNNL